jgi:hypothetical protein
VTIHVALARTPEDALRAVHAEARDDGTYVILSRNDDPESEEWQFPPGARVRCEQREIGGVDYLIATELVPPSAPRLAWARETR